MINRYEGYIVKRVSDHEFGLSLYFENDLNTKFEGCILDITKSRPDLISIIESGSQLKLKLESEFNLPTITEAHIKVNNKYMKIFPEEPDFFQKNLNNFDYFPTLR